MLKLLALALLAGAVQAQADPPGRVGRLAALQGEVWVQDGAQGEWVAALPNRPFTGGERLSTGADASAELRIGSTTVFLGGQTEFEALRLDDERLQLRLQRGQMALRVASPEVASELEVLHPEARFRPLRPGLYRIDRLAEASDASVWRGELQVDAHNLSLTLQTGQRAAFWREGALGDTTHQWLEVQQDAFAQAVQREDQALARLPSAGSVAVEMTGAEDLQRYGSWQQHPELGAVWIPGAVAPGWAPYQQGQWLWMQPWGWTWVDAAPWGFAPFHYGRWLQWGNRWAWAPGPRRPRPVYAPGPVGRMPAPPPPGAAWVGRPPPPPGGVWHGRPPPGGAWDRPPPAGGWVGRPPPGGGWADRPPPGGTGSARPPAGGGPFGGPPPDRRPRPFHPDAPGRERERVAPRSPQPVAPAQPTPPPMAAIPPASPRPEAAAPPRGGMPAGPPPGARAPAAKNVPAADPGERRRTPRER